MNTHIVQNEAGSFVAKYIPGLQAVGGGSVPIDATGVQVTAVGSAPTFIAGMIGINQMTASALGGGGFTPLDIVLVIDKSGSMDDDSCDFKRFFAPGQPCVDVNGGAINSTSCAQCVGHWSSSRCYWPNNQLMSPPPAKCGAIANSTQCTNCKGIWIPPPEPVSATKAAANSFVTLNNPNLSHLALVTFGTNAQQVVHLTNAFASVTSGINAITIAGDCTNASAGLQLALDEIQTNGRSDAIKFIVFLTDGVPNYPQCTNCCKTPNCCPAAVSAAKTKASTAAGRAIVIYTIGLGADVDQQMLRDIASITGGEFFYAPSASDLTGIYATIFEMIKLRLVQ